jgi:preprotein translocase subunit SecG
MLLDSRAMSRLALAACVALAVVLALAPAALGADRIDGGEGAYGETNDSVVTNAGFILIAAFPLVALLLTLLQWRLDKRKEARKQARKAAARGGW